MPTVAEETVPRIDFDAVASMADSILNGGYTFRDYTTITDQEAEAAYALASQLINQRQYAKAEQLFEFLCWMDHYRSKYWLGLGISRQLQSKHAEALPAYSMAGLNDVKNPVPPLRAAECFLALNRLDDAQNGATAAVHWAAQRPDCAKIKARAELILDGIQNRRKEQPCHSA